MGKGLQSLRRPSLELGAEAGEEVTGEQAKGAIARVSKGGLEGIDGQKPPITLSHHLIALASPEQAGGVEALAAILAHHPRQAAAGGSGLVAMVAGQFCVAVDKQNAERCAFPSEMLAGAAPSGLGDAKAGAASP